MAKLQDLSNELLILIFDFVPPGPLARFSRNRTRFALSLVSRRFHAVAEASLYRDVSFNRDPSRCLMLLVRSLIERPALGVGIRKFESLDPWAHSNIPVKAVLDLKTVTEIKKRVGDTSRGRSEANRWIDGIESGHWYALVALTLTFTPNIQTLRLSCLETSFNDHYTNNSLMDLISRVTELQENRDFDNPLSFRKLTQVSSTINRCAREEANVLRFLIPSISKLHLTQVMRDFDFDDSFFPSRIFPNVKTLQLRDFDIPPTIFDELLTHLPNVESLYMEGQAYPKHNFNPRSFLASISRWKNTLRELTIISYDDESTGRRLDPNQYALGSLRGFRKLARITAFPETLMGKPDLVLESGVFDEDEFPSQLFLSEVLPASLESLTFVKGNTRHEAINEQIGTVIAVKGTHFPVLKSLDLGWTTSSKYRRDACYGVDEIQHEGFTEVEAQQLLKDMKAAGVEMMLDGDPRPVREFVEW